MKQEFYPTDMEDHVRIDKYLAEACPDLSRSYIQKLLKSGQVLVNGQGVKASYIVEEDDRIELEVPEAVEPEIDAEPWTWIFSMRTRTLSSSTSLKEWWSIRLPDITAIPL